MTIYVTRDRQGFKFFSKKPKFLQGFDIFSGEECREPQKRDRVIRNFAAKVRRTGTNLDSFYPDIFKVQTDYVRRAN